MHCLPSLKLSTPVQCSNTWVHKIIENHYLAFNIKRVRKNYAMFIIIDKQIEVGWNLWPPGWIKGFSLLFQAK